VRTRRLAALGLSARLARAVGLTAPLEVAVNLLDWAFMKWGHPPLEAEVDGLTISGFLRHRSFLAGLSEEYEPFTRELFERAVHDAPAVIDGGAHIGLYTLIAARNEAVEEVWAVEPDPYNLKALLFNIRRNGLQRNARVVGAALSDRSEVTNFFRGRSTIGGSLGRREDIGEVRTVEVQATTVDSILQDSSPERIVVKLDVEGSERRALRGMMRTLERAAGVTLITEVNPSALASVGETPEGLVEELEGTALTVFAVDERRRTLAPLVDKGKPFKGNLYCVKAGSAGA
jgi:FkbM family methyltransferase